MQPPVRAAMGLARALAGGALRPLLPTRGRHAEIVRRLRRQAGFCLEFGDTRRQDFDLPGQYGNRFRLGQNQPDRRFLVER